MTTTTTAQALRLLWVYWAVMPFLPKQMQLQPCRAGANLVLCVESGE